jgi:gamma-tubulin complex component 3
MKKYLRVFNFLWRLKRVEHALSSIWQAMKPSVQLFDRVRNQQSENVLGIKDEVRRCHCVRNEMSNFCMNLQYYIMFVVLAESWTEFEEKIKNASDLDTLILAHETYLGNIVEKALLGDRSQALVRQLNLIFDLIMRFQGFSGRIQEILQEASSKRRMRTLRAEMETAQGNWGVGGEEQADPEVEMDIDCFPERFLYSTRFELDAITGDYRVLVDGFLKLFSTVPHIDLGSLEQKINLHYDA